MDPETEQSGESIGARVQNRHQVDFVEIVESEFRDAFTPSGEQRKNPARKSQLV